jgi:hypothetical protein
VDALSFFPTSWIFSNSFSLPFRILFYFWNRSSYFSIFFHFFLYCSIFNCLAYFLEQCERLLFERLRVRSASCLDEASAKFIFLWFKLLDCCWECLTFLDRHYGYEVCSFILPACSWIDTDSCLLGLFFLDVCKSSFDFLRYLMLPLGDFLAEGFDITLLFILAFWSERKTACK